MVRADKDVCELGKLKDRSISVADFDDEDGRDDGEGLLPSEITLASTKMGLRCRCTKRLLFDVLAMEDNRIASTTLTEAHDDLATTGQPSLCHRLWSTGGEAPAGTTQRSTWEVSINGDGSPASSVNSHKSAVRIQKFLMNAILQYSGTGGVHKLQDFEAKMDAYIRQDENMSPSTVLALATSRLTDIASLWWQKHETSIALDDP
ncbi:hypothetical protein HDU90_007474 [Geranomyces variabilis]|nr:hypothetical protein HDU90_007474 [Geranomyces variabilis]